MYRRTRVAPKLSDFQKLKRFIWCQQNQNTDFSNYLFVDETTVRGLEIPLYHVRPRGERPDAVSSTSKIRVKVNVCGGISFKGPTRFLVKNNLLLSF